MFDQIEKLKQDLTDKYVVVDASLPELARFQGHVGQVKTVNMNGRALVQFDAWSNIGWYDIDVACLKVVPKPEAGAEGKKEAKKPEAKEAAKPAAAAGAAAPAGEKKLSPIEMARMQGAAKSGGAPAAKPAAKPAPAAGGKPSTADILAAARANKAAAASAASAPAAPAEAPAASEEPVVAAPKAAAKPAPAAAPAAKPGERLSVSQMLAYCRQHDTK